MSDFFKGVRKHIGKLDAAHLREQFERVADALERSETLIRTLKEGLVRLDAHGLVVQANPAARQLLGMPPEDFLPTLALPLGKSSKREIEVTYPERRALEIQTIPFDDETIVYVRDITAEKARTEEELRCAPARRRPSATSPPASPTRSATPSTRSRSTSRCSSATRPTGSPSRYARAR